jgi:hypothetical protein
MQNPLTENTTMQNAIIERRILRFITLFQNYSFEEYFGIVNTNETYLKMNLFIQENEFIFTINFQKYYKCYDILELPIEISRLIASYNRDIITIKIKILLTDDYPFTRPVWVLDSVEGNINTQLNLTEYYEYIVENHNNMYELDWSPAISIDKDILEFVQKINHFDYVLDYN